MHAIRRRIFCRKDLGDDKIMGITDTFEVYPDMRIDLNRTEAVRHRNVAVPPPCRMREDNPQGSTLSSLNAGCTALETKACPTLKRVSMLCNSTRSWTSPVLQPPQMNRSLRQAWWKAVEYSRRSVEDIFLRGAAAMLKLMMDVGASFEDAGRFGLLPESSCNCNL